MEQKLGLNKLQEKTLELFATSGLKEKFYWAGGTALAAVYLGHRFSEDLDFFSDNKFSFDDVKDFAEDIKSTFHLSNIESRKIYDRWEFLITNDEKVKIEFVWYEHKKLRERKRWQGIMVDSLDDIAANKVMALFDRNDVKDLFDLYFLMIKRQYSVKRLLNLESKKFGLSLTSDSFWSECFKPLKDLENIRPFLLVNDRSAQDKLLKEIRDYFAEYSARYLHSILE